MAKIDNVELTPCACGGEPVLTTIAIVMDSDLLAHYMQCSQCGAIGDSSPIPREAALYWNYIKLHKEDKHHGGSNT